MSRKPTPAETLQRLIAAGARAHDAVAARLGLNPTDLRCLELVSSEPGLTPTRLAELAGLTSGAITGVLDRLEEAGYLRRQADAVDRRRLTVSIEAARQAEWAHPFETLAERAAELGMNLPDEARGALPAYLDGLAGLLSAETDRLRVKTRGGMIGDTYVAPRLEVSVARLVFATGAPRISVGGAALGQQVRMVAEAAASRLVLSAGDTEDELLRARFTGPSPDVRASGGTVTMRYRRRLIDTRSRRASVALQPGLPWRVEVSGGITDLEGDLRAITLAGLEVTGGANHLRLRLGPPSGTARIVLHGGASDVRLFRPPDVGVDLRIRGGVSHLRFDARRYDGVTGELRLQSDDLASAADRYEIELAGGTSHATVSTSTTER